MKLPVRLANKYAKQLDADPDVRKLRHEIRNLHQMAKHDASTKNILHGKIHELYNLEVRKVKEWQRGQTEEVRMPRVLNKKTHGIPKGAKYVGRPSKFGNPHPVGYCNLCKKTHNRKEAITLFIQEMTPELKMAARKELKGKDLVCWCHPLDCHANYLLKLANQ